MYLQITNIFDHGEAGLSADPFTSLDEAERNASDFSDIYSHSLRDDGTSITRIDLLSDETREGNAISYFQELASDERRENAA